MNALNDAIVFVCSLLVGAVLVEALVLWLQRAHLKELRRRMAKLRKSVEPSIQRWTTTASELIALQQEVRRVAIRIEDDMLKMRAELITREGAEKLVERVNVVSKDVMALTTQVNQLSRSANAIGLKKLASGVVPPPPKEE